MENEYNKLQKSQRRAFPFNPKWKRGEPYQYPEKALRAARSFNTNKEWMKTCLSQQKTNKRLKR